MCPTLLGVSYMSHFLKSLIKLKILTGNLLINEEDPMATSTEKPTTATLRRFSINPDKLSNEFEIWTLEFPFGEAVWRYKTKVEDRIKDKVKGEYIGVPYRQLNNALMAVCPTLTHGFEYAGKGKPYRA